MIVMPSRPLSNLRRTTLLLAGLCALGVCLGACASGQDREAYFESRSTLVTAKPGTGSTRVALWPAGAWGRSTIAVADRRTATDARPDLPAAPTDSTR